MKNKSYYARSRSFFAKRQLRFGVKLRFERKIKTGFGRRLKVFVRNRSCWRELFNRLMEVLTHMDRKLNRIEKILKKLTVDIEEEARSIIKYRLREMGIDVDIDVLKLPDFELNIYGVSDNICVVGEASLRAGASIIDELKRKLNTLKTKYPGYLREKIILVLYVTLPLPELVERAKKEHIWLLKATKEYVKPKIPN